ncbi:MAG: class I SAM-dependent methyltransferase [Armatimonadetes bacterium]|nr:class I SAM-dependent methyltransferase [Armatimonadota bacterium]
MREQCTKQVFVGVTHGRTGHVHHGDVLALPFADGAFDVVWCSRVLHHVRRPVDAAPELLRVTRAGGTLAIREGGVRPRMLPFDIGIGEPGLEDRMEAVWARWFAAMQRDTLGGLPHPHGWTRLLREAGAANVRARTFITDALPPFSAEAERWLAKQLRRALDWDRGPYGPFLDDADRATLTTISDPTSPHYALRRDDLHVVLGDSVYAGRRPPR